MRFWIISFILLLGSAELYQWLGRFTLPLPIFVLGGLFLAILSNHDKGLPFQFSWHPADDGHDKLKSPPTATSSQLGRGQPVSPELPIVQSFSPPRPNAPISFEIKKNTPPN